MRPFPTIGIFFSSAAATLFRSCCLSTCASILAFPIPSALSCSDLCTVLAIVLFFRASRPINNRRRGQ